MMYVIQIYDNQSFAWLDIITNNDYNNILKLYDTYVEYNPDEYFRLSIILANSYDKKKENGSKIP